jgi:competence protein ComEA
MKRLALLVPFLALSLAQAQDLPEGKGKDLLMKICADCHGLDVIVNMKASKDGWQSIVDSMVGRGASGTKEELDTIIDYLAKNFGEKKIDKASTRNQPIRPAAFR